MVITLAADLVSTLNRDACIVLLIGDAGNINTSTTTGVVFRQLEDSSISIG
jgi:hypothetical protein